VVAAGRVVVVEVEVEEVVRSSAGVRVSTRSVAVGSPSTSVAIVARIMLPLFRSSRGRG